MRKLRSNMPLMENNKLETPQILTIDITDRCQMQCKTCSKWKVSAEVKDKELTTEQWKTVFEKLKNWLPNGYWICFSGGEPFLRPDLLELVDYATSLGFRVSTMSNGYSLMNHIDEILNCKLESINISLNSIIDKGIHDSSRGREESAQKIFDVIWQIMNRKKGINDNLSINIATIMLPENLQEIVPLVEYTTKNKLKHIMFQLIEDEESFHAYAEKSGLDAKNYKIPKEYRDKIKGMSEKATGVINYLIDMKRAGHSIANTYEQLDAYKKFFNNPESIVKEIKCDVGSTNFAIDPYGDVRLCFNMNPIGSILDKSPEELWTGKEAEECRNAVRHCKMCCRLINCNFKANFVNFNKPFLVRQINKIKKLITGRY